MNHTALLTRLRALASREHVDPSTAEELRGLIRELGADRYLRGQRIGEGGMGEVTAAKDAQLHRVVAQKSIQPKFAANAEMRNAFAWEAWITAQLEHPDIVPLYDAGLMQDGRPFFTMRWVRWDGVSGTRTLLDVVEAVHAAADEASWRPTPEGWSFHGLLAALLRVADAVAYAHARGVCHLDLKPDNVLIGHFGEIALIDWGIAKLVAAEPPMEPVTMPEGVRPGGGGLGTPQYMAPEQASDKPEIRASIGKPSDVYALGAVLYHILSGEPPLSGPSKLVYQLLRSGSYTIERPGRALQRDGDGATWCTLGMGEVDDTLSPLVPSELQDLCMRALEPAQADRFPNAGAFAAALRSWLDGSKRRAEAEASLARARDLLPEIERLQSAAAAARVDAEVLRAATDPWRDVEEKAGVWAAEDEAVRLDLAAAVLQANFTSLVHASLAGVPDFEEAHALLATHYESAHTSAVLNRDDRAAKLADTLRASHDLRGDAPRAPARVELTFDAPVVARLSAVSEQRRRLVETPVAMTTGAVAAFEGLFAGRHVVDVSASAGVSFRIPVALRAGETGPPPGDGRPIRVPAAGTLGDEDVYVAGGWMWTGGPSTVPGAGPWRRVWVDDFVVRRFSVTMGEFILFLDDLVRTGREHIALDLQPRERGANGATLLARKADGRFAVTRDGEGDLWDARWPAYNVDWDSARAYCSWLKGQTGLPWRLPLELEWEKAARGTDGRLYPWGDHFDPTWARIRDSAKAPHPVTVDEYPTDVSPYGVRGMAGTARDWCADEWRPGGPRVEHDRPVPSAAVATHRVIRGGGWSSGVNYASCAARDGDAPTSHLGHVAFRLVRSMG